MNCIVSLTATFPNGRSVQAVQTGRINSWDSRDFEENVRTYTAEEWQIEGLKSSAGTNKIATQFWIQNPVNTSQVTDYGALDMTIFASLFDAPQEKISSPLCENGDLISPCLFPPQLQPNVIFTIVLNSDLLKPAFTSGSVLGARFTQEKLNNGYQFTISGAAMKIPVNLPDSKHTAPGDFPQALDDRFYWHLYTVDLRNPQFDWASSRNCSTGNPIISSNAASAGIPSYDTVSKEVLLQVSSPHVSADGMNLETGFFQAIMPIQGIKCLWGISQTQLATSTQISVTYSDGTAETASLATKIDNENFVINASGFHYSNPILHLTFKKPALSKVSTLVCYKGKKTITVKATNPTCPKGYLPRLLKRS